jgi:GTPase SAR1 family protein
MGLFKRKMETLKRAKMDETHEIICLYCFRNFDHDRVLFRAFAHVDAEGYRACADEVLETYRARFFMDEAGDLPVVLDPDDFNETNKSYHRGILSALTDDFKNITTKRLCPYCHNDLPQSAGFAPGTIISFVGASQAGKSVYLTSLVHTLKTLTSRNFQIFCTPINNETGRKFKENYENPLIENGKLLDPTQKEKQQEPFIFTFSFADSHLPEINIAFFDVAGEGMVDKTYMDMYAAHIRNSSGVLFLVDPTQFRLIGKKITLMNGLDMDASKTDEPLEVLNGLVEDYIYKQASGVSQIPTALVLTKTDLLRPLQSEGEYIQENSHFFSNYTHKGFFDLEAFHQIDDETDGFLNAVDPNFRNALKRRFAHLGFFAVSALGTHPDTLQQRVASFAPIRVDEPFLWLLYKLGYIKGD